MKLKGAKFRKGKDVATKGVWMWMYPFKIDKVGKPVIMFLTISLFCWMFYLCT